ncbi:hypothetical protein CD798_06565 [Bacillaceae bacterium SAOS 7]|nr:hypothetical protein CD798_06565 [Bacillaceae bacterium SAOS 7]
MNQHVPPAKELSVEDFFLFLNTNANQLKRNMHMYLKLHSSLSGTELKIIELLIESFFQYTTLQPNSSIKSEEQKQINAWIQDHISILNFERIHQFHIIFEKAVATLKVNHKNDLIISVIVFFQSISSKLSQSYKNWNENNLKTEGSLSSNTNPEKYLMNKYKVINQLDKVIIQSSGMKDLAYILKACEEILNFKRCVFYAYIHWTKEFKGIIGSELSKVQSFKGTVQSYPSLKTLLLTRKPVFIKNDASSIPEETIKLFDLSSLIIVPITYEQDVVGWLTFDQMGVEFDYSAEELQLLEEIGQRIGLFINNCEEKNLIRTNIQLTERESNILTLLAEGYDNKKMGEYLHLSEHTVRDYISNLMTKLNAKNRTQVVSKGFRLGLLQ